jgi:hypothetical protein
MSPLSRAELKIICFAKNPTKGGTPINEYKVTDKLIAKIGFK